MINRFLAAVVVLLCTSFTQENHPGNEPCTFKGKKLYGKVKFVESFPDLTIQLVNSFPDLRVKFVTAFADECGEWELTESFPDLKVKVVAANADLKVQVVENFPGLD